MSDRAGTALALALVASSCARDNPLFGLDGSAEAGAESEAGTTGTTGNDSGVDTTEASSTGSTSGRGSGTADGTGDPLPMSCGDDDPETTHIHVDADMFVDSRERCDGGDCADRNFGVTPMRPVGAVDTSGGSGGGEIVYVMRFDPGVVADASAIIGVDLLIPVASATPQPTIAKIYRVSFAMVEGNGNGTLEAAASTWNHAIAPKVDWQVPSRQSGDFGVFETYAREQETLREFPISAAMLEPGDPPLLRLGLMQDEVERISEVLANGIPIQAAFATEDITAGWQVLAIEAEQATAELRLKVCVP